MCSLFDLDLICFLSFLSLKVPQLILFEFAPKRYPHRLSNTKQGELSFVLSFNSNANPSLSVYLKFVNFRFHLFTPL
jgi:hypothetical protein